MYGAIRCARSKHINITAFLSTNCTTELRSLVVITNSETISGYSRENTEEIKMYMAGTI
uniref:Uncharacterized protein n=1 Tax=Arion vulgaris TaxID=1028688 RepID=A0A0B6XYH6_9EUPU